MTMPGRINSLRLRIECLQWVNNSPRRWVHRAASSGWEDVHVDGRTVSKELIKPFTMEKPVIIANIEASVNAASPAVESCPMNMTGIITNAYSEICVLSRTNMNRFAQKAACRTTYPNIGLVYCSRVVNSSPNIVVRLFLAFPKSSRVSASNSGSTGFRSGVTSVGRDVGLNPTKS